MIRMALILSVAGAVIAMAVAAAIYLAYKKRYRLLLYPACVIIVFTAIAIAGAYRLAISAKHKVKTAMQPRNGTEIYEAIFGRPDCKCVKVLAYQDQVIPKIDCAIFLYFETTPQEIKRIIAHANYTAEKKSSAGMDTNEPSDNNKWFQPCRLGDTLLYLQYAAPDGRRIQQLYLSCDSTRAYYKDVLD